MVPPAALFNRPLHLNREGVLINVSVRVCFHD